MDTAQVSDVMRDAVMVAIKLGGPALVISLLVGVIVAIFQAVTQIHEQSLSFLLKLLVVVLVFMLGGGWMMDTLLDYTKGLFTLMIG